MDSVRKNVHGKSKVFRISKSKSSSSPDVASNQMTACESDDCIDDQETLEEQQRLKELPELSNSKDPNVLKSSFELTIRNQLL